ncbi:MAG TPA: hypothetical protein VMY88_00180 [Acidimicrobiales bacterium]|nr:hypothetical protein [Acidimicrobiales bacterium]
MARFEFRFAPVHRVLSAPFGVTPETTMVEVSEGEFRARFGPWVVVTPLSNIAGAEQTGPYAVLKTVLSARLSLVDRGLTMATNADGGLCVRFREPVRGIDPLGLIRHPGLTVTVARPDELRKALLEPLDDQELEDLSTGVTGESPWAIARRWMRWPVGMAVAVARYASLLRAMERTTVKRGGPHPELSPPADTADLQPIETGVGPAYERIYRVVFEAPGATPEQLLDQIVQDLNAVSPTEVAEFVSRTSEPAEADLGQEYVVRMPGPWDAVVRLIDRSPTSFRLATLKGHMEAGQIEFRTGHVEPATSTSSTAPLYFEVRSVARSANRPFGLLYEKLWFASEMQMHMWVHLCTRVIELAGGKRIGKVQVQTVRYAR